MQHLIIVSILFTIFLPLQAMACYNDNECLFGNCDQDNNNCQCNLCDVESFVIHPVCTQRTCNRTQNGTTACLPKLICFEANEQCTVDTLSIVKRIPIEEYLEYDSNGRDCSYILYEEDGFPEERYCRDQTYCNGNGVCLESADNSSSSEPFCICNKNHEGARCDLLKEPTTPSVSQKFKKFDSKKPKYKGSSVATVTQIPSLAMLVVAVTPCMVIGFIYFNHQRRNVTENQASQQDCEIGKIDIQSANQTTSIECFFKPRNNRNDLIQEDPKIISRTIETYSSSASLLYNKQLSVETNL